MVRAPKKKNCEFSVGFKFVIIIIDITFIYINNYNTKSVLI